MRDDLYTYPVLGWLRTIALGIAAFVAACWGGYVLAIAISPPYTRDGHPLMPIGQVFIAFVVGLVAMIVVMVLDRRHQWLKRQAVIDAYTAPAPARVLRR